MNIIDIIIKKKNKEELTEAEIKYTIDNFVKLYKVAKKDSKKSKDDKK